MKISHWGIEIEGGTAARTAGLKHSVNGEWLTFVDSDGVEIKIDPLIVLILYEHMADNIQTEAFTDVEDLLLIHGYIPRKRKEKK